MIVYYPGRKQIHYFSLIHNNVIIDLKSMHLINAHLCILLRHYLFGLCDHVVHYVVPTIVSASLLLC